MTLFEGCLLAKVERTADGKFKLVEGEAQHLFTVERIFSRFRPDYKVNASIEITEVE